VARTNLPFMPGLDLPTLERAARRATGSDVIAFARPASVLLVIASDDPVAHVRAEQALVPWLRPYGVAVVTDAGSDTWLCAPARYPREFARGGRDPYSAR
jgi:hypothetical protein